MKDLKDETKLNYEYVMEALTEYHMATGSKHPKHEELYENATILAEMFCAGELEELSQEIVSSIPNGGHL